MKKQDFEKAQLLISQIEEINDFKNILINAKFFKIETSETQEEKSFSFDINRFSKIEKYTNGNEPSEFHAIRNKYHDIIREKVFEYLNTIKELNQAEFDKL